MAGENGFAQGLRGIPDLGYEVTIEVKDKKTGKVDRMFYPNVGGVNADHQLTRECAGLEKWALAGMPQALFLMVGFNASPRTGKTLEIKDGGAGAFGSREAGNTAEDDAELDGE